MPKEEKSAEIEVQRRVELCLQRMLVGWIPYRIAQYVARMAVLTGAGKTHEEEYQVDWDWGVQQRQIYEYCTRATDELEKIQVVKRKANFNLAIARWNEMLRKAIFSSDLGNARLIQKEIDKLNGIHEFGAGGSEGTPEPTQFKLGDGTVIDL